MENLTEDLKEKSINFWIRNILRLMAWVILLFYMIFRILIPIKDNSKVLLDTNDGWVIFGCMCLLFAIEGVRAVLKARLKKLEGEAELITKSKNIIQQDMHANGNGGGAVTPKKGF